MDAVFVTGQHKYASDMNLVGIFHGKILRPTAFHATLDSVDTKEAEDRPRWPRWLRNKPGFSWESRLPTRAKRSGPSLRLQAEWKTPPQP